MASNKIMLALTLALMAIATEAGLLAPAPVPQAIGYHHAVPYNVPPYSDRTDIFTKALSVPVAYAPAPVLHAAPVAAPVLPHPVAYAPAPFAHAVPHAHIAPAVAPIAYPSGYDIPYGVSPYAVPAGPVWRR